MAADRGVSGLLDDSSLTFTKVLFPDQNDFVTSMCPPVLISFYCCTHLQNDSALLFLGQCYENGFGVQRNVRTAREYYKRAVQVGNKQAKSLLTPADATNCKGDSVLPSVTSQLVVTRMNTTFSFSSPAEDAMLRSISSAPCFSAADRHPQQPLSPHLTPPAFTLPLLPHSWSTGSLCIPPYLSSSLLPLNTEGGTCQWTLGLG